MTASAERFIAVNAPQAAWAQSPSGISHRY
jgi:hypothetical protein